MLDAAPEPSPARRGTRAFSQSLFIESDVALRCATTTSAASIYRRHGHRDRTCLHLGDVGCHRRQSPALRQAKGDAARQRARRVFATVCGAVDMVSFQFAPQSLLAPFAALGLLVNLFLAPMHGEKITPMDLLCTALAVGGVAVCLSSASTDMPPRTPDELAALATRPAFLGWAAVEASVLVAAAARARLGKAASTLTAVGWAVSAGVCGGCTSLGQGPHRMRQRQGAFSVDRLRRCMHRPLCHLSGDDLERGGRQILAAINRAALYGGEPRDECLRWWDLF